LFEDLPGLGLYIFNLAYLLLIGLMYLCTKFRRNRSSRLGMNKGQTDRNSFLYTSESGPCDYCYKEYSLFQKLKRFLQVPTDFIELYKIVL